MSSSDELFYYKPCKKCSGPVDEGSIGTKHNMCFECAQKTYGITDAGSASGTKSRKSADNQSNVGTTTDGQNEVDGSEEGYVGEDDNNKGKKRAGGTSIPVADDNESKASSGPKVRYAPPPRVFWVTYIE